MEISFGETVRKLREKDNLLLRQLAAKLDIDTSLLSKIETNNRIANKEFVEKIAKVFDVDCNELLIIWFSDKIANELKGHNNIDEIFKIAVKKIENEE